MKNTISSLLATSNCSRKSTSILSLTFKQPWLKTVALSLLLCVFTGHAWGGSIELTYSDFGYTNTTYATKTCTKGGVSFTCTDGSKNVNLTLKKSTGEVHNTTAMPGNITSIVIEGCSFSSSSSAGFYVYGGTSSAPTTTTLLNNTGTTGTQTASFSGYSYKYFKIQNKGTRTFTSTKITINYEDGASCTTIPTVSAGSNSSVASTTATVSCSSGISSLGSAGCSISSYGFVIGTSSSPSIGGSGVTKHEVGTSYTTTGTSFSKNLTGLSASTTYYVRPYATNGKGTAYGTQTSFTTSALPKFTVTLKDDNSTITQASAGASITLPSRDGCTGYHFEGWSTTNNTSWTTTAPTIINAGSYTPTANINLYPVYTKTEGGGGGTTGSKTLVSSTSSTYYTSGDITGVAGTNSASWTADEFTMVQYKNSSSSAVSLSYAEIRAYANHSLVFTPSSGTTITSIVVTANSASYATALGGSSIDNCTKSVSGSTVIILPTDGTSAITLVQAAQSRLNKIVVNYSTSGGSTTSYISVPACTSYTLSSAVNPTGKAMVTLGTTSLLAGGTTTASYSGITAGYEFVNWTISGGATLSSTTATPTTVTMGSADATITANLQCITPTFSKDLSAAQVTYVQNATATALSVTAAAGGADLSYQWQQSANGTSGWSNVGTNNKSYTPSTATTGDQYYRCIVTNAATGCSTSATSKVAHIHVNAPATPTLVASPTSLDWGTVNQNSSQSTKTFSISGSYLTGSLTIAASSGWSVTPTSKSVSGTLNATTITVTPPSTATAGNKDGTITISGGGLASPEVVTVTMTVAPLYTVSFNTGTNNPTQADITETNSGAGITLPAGPTPACSTEDWTFAGWKETSAVSAKTTTAPTLLAAGANYKPTTDCTLYAVYKRTEGGDVVTWTRVTAIETLTAGGTFIMGYEATAKSGIIVPLRSADCDAKTTANGYFYSGTTAASSTSGTIDMTGTVSSGDYEIYISSPATGKINIQMGTSSGNYYGATSGGTTSNKGRLYTSGNSAETNLTPQWTNQANNQFRLLSDVAGDYKWLKYNTGSPRFAYYNSAGDKIVFYKKGTNATIAYWSSPTCCTNFITITKGSDPANGTFTISPSGKVCIDDANASTTVTATPATNYHLATVTSTNGTVGTITDNTCTISNISANTTINVTFAENARDTVKWFVANDFTKEVKFAGETLAGVEDPDGSVVCDGKTFMGWTADPTYFHLTDAPDDLFTDATTKTMPAGGTSYYAVFASLTGAMPVKLIDETFDNDLSGDATSEFPDNTFANFPTGNSKAYKGAGGTIKLGSGSAFGYITSKSLDLSNAFTVKFKAKKYGTDGSKIKVTVGSESHETDVLTSDFAEYSFDFAAATATSTVKIETTTAKRAYIDDVQVISGGGTYTDYGVSCVTYEVTATTNNASYGTVSVSGYKITATPAVGYVADGYTVTAGTVADVIRDENVFKVIPTSDCTIRINFRKAAQYTVTFYDNNTTYTQKAYEGTPLDLPSTGRSNCPDATFLGWAEGTYTDHATGTSIKPDYVEGGSDVDITADTYFTAVYGVTELGNTYTALKTESELTSGSKYVIAAYYSNYDYAMKGTMSSARVDAVKTTYSITSGNEVTNTALCWVIDIVEAAGKRVTLFNPSAGKYISINSSGDIELADDPFIFRYEVDESGEAATWNFFSPSDATQMLSFYASKTQYNIYSSNSSSIYIYKQTPTMSSYTSHPNCCVEPATPMTISTDMTTYVLTSDKVITSAIKVTGGNGTTINWTATGGSMKQPATGTSTVDTIRTPGVYTITATQEDKAATPNDICGASLSVTITVKAQWKIMLVTVTDNVETKYDSLIVVDGENYTLPDIGEDFSCEEGISFAGWSTDKAATAVEAAAGATKTASADVKWYALWATAEQRTVPLYEKVTDASSLAANKYILITDEEGTVALNTNQDNNNRKASSVTTNPDNANQIYFVPTAGDNPQELKLGGSSSGWSLKDVDRNGFLYAASSSSNHLKTQTTNDANGLWTIAIADGVATITATGTYTHNILRYNSNSQLFSCYQSGQAPVAIYLKTSKTKTVDGFSETVTSNTNCTMSAVIRANTDQWITAAKGQKVKRVYEVTAKGFLLAAATLSIDGNTDATHFTPTLNRTDIPKGAAGRKFYLTVEYLPTEADEENVTTITLLGSNTQGESVTKTLVIHGRSLPDEFLMITKNTYWYALPANMNGGAGQYAGVNVTPDDATEPSIVPVAPSTVVYSLRSNSATRYGMKINTLNDKGQYVRLAGNGGKGLWADTISNKTEIQNDSVLAEANSGRYEWELKTTDGVHYTVANPAHKDYSKGRVLAYSSKFAMLKEPTVFFLVPAGCSSQPQDVVVKPKREEATFSWVGNASSYTIDAYTDAEMTGTAVSTTTSSSPAIMHGLTEETKYWYRITPEGAAACAVTGTFTTSGPTIDVVEWEEDAAIIFVDKDDDLHPKIIIEGEKEHGVGSGSVATELFFAKYFEGAGDMKLLSIYNGTTNDIELDDYKIFMYCIGSSGTHSAQNDKDYPLKALGTIKAGQEIIFFTRDSRTGDITDAIKELQECTDGFMDSVAQLNRATDNPRWIECNGSKTYNGTTFKKFDFSGNDPLYLLKNDVKIDIFGAETTAPTTNNCKSNEKAWKSNLYIQNMDYKKSPSDPEYKELFKASSLSPVTTADSIEVLANMNINLEDSLIEATTARCILFRSNLVTSGADAAAANTGSTFASFTSDEWRGRNICLSSSGGAAAGVANDSKLTCNSYQDLGTFDYNQYYKEWDKIGDDKVLDSYLRDPETKTYEIPIEDLSNYSCLNVRFQLTDPDDAHVITEAPVQVPILVSGNKSTNHAIFNEIVKTDGGVPLYGESVTRCQTCNVVILSNGVLTKAATGTTNDAKEVGDLKIYPGGKLVVPSGTTDFKVNSLAFRRQEDDIPTADIQGSIGFPSTAPVSTFLDIRIDPTNWHYFTLPYDCNVSDVTFVDGTRAVVGTDYFLSSYDGEHRAATKTSSWKDLTSSDVLHKGIGYIIALPGDGKVQRELRFPMSNSVIADEQENKDIGNLHAWGGDKDDTELTPNHKGWNLVGNPYLTYYNSTWGDPLALGALIHDPDEDPWEGHWVIDEETASLRYIVVPQEHGWSEYLQVRVDDSAYPMKPFTSFFVQIGGDDPGTEQVINFVASKAQHQSIVRRQPAEYEDDNHEVWFGINLINSTGEKDETALLISDQFTDEYDMMDDLVKMRGTYYKYYSKPVLASRNSAGEMAFNALPDQSAKEGVPLNFYAAAKDDYTIAIDGRYSLDEIKEAQLYDAELDKWHDLLAGNYSFAVAKKGDNKTRFTLYVTVERKQPQVTTEKDNIYGQLTLTTLDKTLVLSGLREDADIYVYDISGKLMAAGTYRLSDDNSVWRTTVPAQGIYFVRVVKGTKQQTLNTIVY